MSPCRSFYSLIIALSNIRLQYQLNPCLNLIASAHPYPPRVGVQLPTPNRNSLCKAEASHVRRAAAAATQMLWGRSQERHLLSPGRGKTACLPSRCYGQEHSPRLPAAYLPRERRCRSVNTSGPLTGGSLLSSWSWRKEERVKSRSLGSGEPLCPRCRQGWHGRSLIRQSYGKGVGLTSPSEGFWTGQPLGTSCNNLAR